MSGGDFVFGSNGVVYGTTDVAGANVFFRQQLSNATNVSSGASWTNFNIDVSLPYATQGLIQVAGLVASTNLYVASTTRQNLYRVNGYNGSSAPTFSQIGGSAVLGVTFTDLSIVLSAPLPVPEAPHGACVGSVVIAAGVVEAVRRKKTGATKSV